MSIASSSHLQNSSPYVQDELLPDNAWCPRITGKLCFARATHQGVQRGEAPLHLFSSPKNGGHRGLKTLMPAEAIRQNEDGATRH